MHKLSEDGLDLTVSCNLMKLFKILFFNDYMAKVHADIMQNYMPKFMDWPGASIWLKRIK